VAKSKKAKKPAAKKTKPAVKKIKSGAAKIVKAKSPAKKMAKKAPAKTTKTKKVALAKPAEKIKLSVKARGPEKKSVLKMKWSEFVTPLDDRVIVLVSAPERKTAGGLFIPDSVADVSGNVQGNVVAVGRGHRDSHGRVRPMDVRIGDRVVFSEHMGSKIEMMGEKAVLLRESEVMGVFTS